MSKEFRRTPGIGKHAILTIAVGWAFLSILSYAAPAEMFVRQRAQMGTYVEIKVQASRGEEAAAASAVEAAFEEIDRVESLMSEYRGKSEVHAINAASGKAPVPVSPEVLQIIERALQVSELTHGAFDITAASLSGLWDFTDGPARLPPDEAIAAVLPLVDHRLIKLDREGRTVFLSKQGMRIGLGAIAKGYAVDRACAVLAGRGVTRAIVNAGGDLRALGRKNGGAWTIGIKGVDKRDSLAARIEVADVAIVTSGDYEKYLEIDGKRYSHLIDPRTGRPAHSGCRSVTVIASSADLADALATGLFILGPDEGLALAEILDNVEALFIDIQGRLRWTSGIVNGSSVDTFKIRRGALTSSD